ncbi:MAG: hypothetical protein RR655_03595 [Raoultibacter sp.]
MMKTKKSSKGLALVLAAVLALTPMAGFPITALATGEAAAPKAEAPATDAAEAPAIDAGETPQADAPATDADASTDTDATPGTTPSTPAPDAKTPQAEVPTTDAGTNPGAAGSATNPPATNVVTPDPTPTPTVDPDAANDGVVNEKDFPDPTFWTYVQKEFDKNGNQTLDTDEIKAATTIDIHWSDITTLQGIEYFTDLTSLTCRASKIEALDLAKNTALTTLNCSGDPYISTRSNLTTLYVSKNTALTSLDCSFNNLTNLDVSANTALTNLACYRNQLTNLDVSKNTALTSLNCGNPYTSVPGNLAKLDVSANTALTNLACNNLQLTTLDVSKNTALTSLNCSDNNQLTTLDLTKNTALVGLNCSSDPYASVPVRGNLTTLDLPATDTLTYLYCNDNQLTALDVSNNPGLTNLTCSNNQLTTLDVSACIVLANLTCKNNQLTTLDLTKNTALIWLFCANNQLTSLNLTGLAKLGSGNQLYEKIILGPQAPQIPVVKRGAQYKLDIEALAKGQPLTAITLDSGLDSEQPVDLKTYDKMHKTAPKTLQYTCETGSLGLNATTMEVKATCVPYHPATLVTDANGTLTCDVASPTADELLLRDGSTPTFTVTPASGYQVATLTVNGKDAMGSLVGETLTLPAVTDAVAIAATFKEIPAPPIVNYYSVTATVENGTITSDHAALVREGSSVKCTFSPNDGYALESVSVNGKAVEATEDSTTTATTKTYSHTINGICSNTTIHVVFKAVEPPVDPTDPVDPPKPPVDPTDPVDPPKPPVDPGDPLKPPPRRLFPITVATATMATTTVAPRLWNAPTP